MSPEQPSAISDHQSKTTRRGRPPVPPERVLRAAESLLADADTPSAVSMDDIAAAAGVGKGTLFRAFGSRDGLLDAVFEARLAPLRAELERPGSAVGPDAAPAERIIALVQLLLDFKLDHPRLVAARELTGSSLLRAPHYRWVHQRLAELIEATGVPAPSAVYTPHLLLNGLRADLVEELLNSGMTRQSLAQELARAVRQLLGEPACPAQDRAQKAGREFS